jgi:hypothetical protein
MSSPIWSFTLSVQKMVRKEIFVIALAWLLVMASMIMSAQAMQDARLHAFEHIVHPQGKVINYLS